MVNLDLYRVFYTVAKNGSLTKAAEELYISQPAVSQSVKQLENQLGVTLFNRTHRGMELSEEGGKRIIGKVERALRLLEEAENEVGGAVARRGAELCLSASDEVFRYILADKIAAFTKKFPAVRLKFCRTGVSRRWKSQQADRAALPCRLSNCVNCPPMPPVTCI